VTDPAEASIKKALADLGYPAVKVKTARRYIFPGQISPSRKRELARSLYNPLIQFIYQGGPIFLYPPRYEFKLNRVKLLGLSPEELEELSVHQGLALNRTELLAIQAHYQKLGRDPTDLELEIIAQTWSEHCKHKTFRGEIEYDGELISDLLKSTIFRVTEELAKEWCLSVFKDNSGVVALDDEWALSFKVETHNHPSAIEPYGGAATGVGGVIRDCLGVGLGAKPILNTDLFCFAPLNFPAQKLPPGVIAPVEILKGVVAGVRDYGNRMGIPTAQGGIYFHEGFLYNPLVYCGTLGLMPRSKVEKQIQPGDLVVLVGGQTGRDGIHGVTFASSPLHLEAAQDFSSAVQIGNPIEEKKLSDAILEARDLGLFSGITDCGGGGLSSAVGEMARCGAVVDLDQVPLKYQGLSYTEIWLSESQERMVVFLPKSHWERFAEVCAHHGVEATRIGALTDDKILRLCYQGQEVGRIDLDFLHEGWPKVRKPAEWKPEVHPEPQMPIPKDLAPHLLALLSSPNIASKEWVIRQYDFEVQGRSVLKPFAGPGQGPSDAVIIQPLPNSLKGVAVASGLNPNYGLIDPYWMAANCLDEALRNLVSVGAAPDRIALLDNFCWGSPDDPAQLGGLIRAARALYDMARVYRVPFISGKDSLYNEYELSGMTHPIPPTLLISGIGLIEDISSVVSSDLKAPDSLIYLLGFTAQELGGSEYYRLYSRLGNRVPRVKPELGRRIMELLHRAITSGLVRSCHDLSEGGLGVALAEQCLSGGIGARIFLKRVPCSEPIERDDHLLFAESSSRFLVEVAPKDQAQFETLISGIPYGMIGKSSPIPRLVICGLNQKVVIDLELDLISQAWHGGLTDILKPHTSGR
jgi:phosphoribosylformylglycinamidine synthase